MFRLNWKKILKKRSIYLYAGDIPRSRNVKKYYNRKDYVGLSLTTNDRRHIIHDITAPYPIPDNSIDNYQAEDVFEHIEYDKLVSVINEIYRVLKPDGVFRLSVPDYRCELLRCRSLKDDEGNIQFDPGGGGDFVDGCVVNGGHIWFPQYESVLKLIELSRFEKYHFYQYTDSYGISKIEGINYKQGYVQRTPDHDKRVQNPRRAMSIVVDLIK